MQETKYTEEFVKSLCKKVAAEACKEEFAIPLSAKLIANMHGAITKEGIPATHILIGSAVWALMMADTAFQHLLDPATRKEDVISGYLGYLLGMDVLADAYFHPTEHYLPRNFCAVVAVKPGGEPEVIKAVSAYVE